MAGAEFLDQRVPGPLAALPPALELQWTFNLRLWHLLFGNRGRCFALIHDTELDSGHWSDSDIDLARQDFPRIGIHGG